MKKYERLKFRQDGAVQTLSPIYIMAKAQPTMAKKTVLHSDPWKLLGAAAVTTDDALADDAELEEPLELLPELDEVEVPFEDEPAADEVELVEMVTVPFEDPDCAR